ncbi:hypothetical protein HDZ31DRAFT_36222 [Schizophyllum fasciatum]
MPQAQVKPLVVVFGATGESGRQIVDGLLRSNVFRVAAVVRDLAKPAAAKLAEKGVALHHADLLTVTQERLQDILTGADTAIAVLLPNCIGAQRKIADAAKVVGLKRFIPNDFATDTPKGVMLLQDRKLAIRDYVREIGIGHTFIEVGWWMQLSVIYPPHINSRTADMPRNFIGSGEVPFAVTDEFHIGDYVARVTQDERTLNQTVFIWDDEVTQTEVWEHAQRKYGPSILEKKKVVRRPHATRFFQHPTEDVLTALESARTGGSEQVMARYLYEYWYTLFIRGDNTAAKAKANGALDFKELYPDIKTSTFAEYVERVDKDPYVPPQLEREIE